MYTFGFSLNVFARQATLEFWAHIRRICKSLCMIRHAVSCKSFDHTSAEILKFPTHLNQLRWWQMMSGTQPSLALVNLSHFGSWQEQFAWKACAPPKLFVRQFSSPKAIPWRGVKINSQWTVPLWPMLPWSSLLIRQFRTLHALLVNLFPRSELTGTSC